ncbi:uncharacterized protein LOC143030002 [Oratosquilla oratoria]|uniref:uncharacterized protein LOC143030002 n=1 Tax=Oratosquilla oratoria TaxID=337810 RepID=UPI003F776694
MEQLVSLPFTAGTVLLSYADDLVLVVTGHGNLIAKTQEALNLLSKKSEELGLKVSAEKSEAMMFSAPAPTQYLHVQDVRLNWTQSYQYLGIWLDHRLTFARQVTYLREKTQARTTVMRAMTRPEAGTSDAVLLLYYVQAIRSLVDYSAPVLVTLGGGLRKRIEVIQNQAMRTMLGAPRWTSACVLQSETRLVPLTIRTQQIVACRVAKILLQGRETAVHSRLRKILPHDRTLFTANTWIYRVGDAANQFMDSTQFLRTPHHLIETYQEPLPWEQPLAEVTYTSLPAAKALCSTEVLRQLALVSMAQAWDPGSAVYFTDGSVDRSRGTTGAAVVTEGQAFSRRTSDHCSTFQTEMVAIQHALRHATDLHEETVIIHTDSRAALQALQQTRPTQDIALITTALSLIQNLVTAGKRVRLNWIPSHVGIRGNEDADAAARAASALPAVSHHAPMSLGQIKVLIDLIILSIFNLSFNVLSLTLTPSLGFVNGVLSKLILSHTNHIVIFPLATGVPLLNASSV